MNSTLCYLLAASALAAFAATATAEVPKKAPLSRYSKLWKESPFTTPPPPPENAPPPNPFENLALRGVAPIAGGYLVTLIDKKDPTQITEIGLKSGSEYKIERVERHPEKPHGTIVHLSKGAIKGTVSYDEKLMVTKTVTKKVGGPPGAQPGMQPGMQPGVQPGANPNDPNAAQRQPRQRVVMPTPVGAVAPGAAAHPGGVPAPGGFTPGGSRGPGGGARSGPSGHTRPQRR